MRPGTLVVNRTVAVLTVALLVSACAPSLKERAVRQVQAVETVLETVQDTEISVYESGIAPALTLEKHQAVHRALVKGFDAVERAAIALRAYRAGDPVPNDVTSILEAAQETLTVLETVAPQAETLVAWVRVWLGHAQALAALLGGQP